MHISIHNYNSLRTKHHKRTVHQMCCVYISKKKLKLLDKRACDTYGGTKVTRKISFIA